MPTNNFLPFAIDPAANVITQGSWAALLARTNGFTAGVAQSGQLNKAWRQSSVMAAVLGQFINDYGALDALDDGNTANLVRDLARTVMQAPWSKVVATGTANAWVLTTAPTVAAYAAGRPLWVKAPATNTSTTVNANVSGLGDRRIKKADGTDPAIGDLLIGRWYATIDDGTSICIVTPLPSDVAAAAKTPAAFTAVTNALQNVPASTLTTVTNFTATQNDLGDSTFASSQLTIGAKDAGWWVIVAKLFWDFPATTMETNVIIERNGVEITAGNANGSTSIRARPNATAVYKLAAGDVIRVRATTTVVRNLEITGGSSIFSGFKVGA